MEDCNDTDSAADSIASDMASLCLGDHVGSVARVLASLSLSSSAMWCHVARIVLEEMAGFVQPVPMGGVVEVVHAGEFGGGISCSVHADEVFICDRAHACLAVYRDGVRRRNISDQLGIGSAVVGDAVFFALYDSQCVAVYPLAGGTCLRRSGPGVFRSARGIAASGGLVYVTDSIGNRVCILTEAGEFHGKLSGGAADMPRGITVTQSQAFVATLRGVAVFPLSTRVLARRIGEDVFRNPEEICAHDEILFVSDARQQLVAVVDAASGHLVASLAFDGWTPSGVAVSEDGVLFVTMMADHNNLLWRLCAAPLR